MWHRNMAFGFQSSAFQNDAFQNGSQVEDPVRRGGGLRQVILKQEEKRDNSALAIFMLDG